MKAILSLRPSLYGVFVQLQNSSRTDEPCDISFAKEAEIIIKSATLTLAHQAFPPKLIHSAVTQGMKGKQFEFLFLFPTLPSATTSCKISGDTSPSWGVVNLPIISYTAAPSPPPSPPSLCSGSMGLEA